MPPHPSRTKALFRFGFSLTCYLTKSPPPQFNNILSLILWSFPPLPRSTTSALAPPISTTDTLKAREKKKKTKKKKKRNRRLPHHTLTVHHRHAGPLRRTPRPIVLLVILLQDGKKHQPAKSTVEAIHNRALFPLLLPSPAGRLGLEVFRGKFRA